MMMKRLGSCDVLAANVGEDWDDRVCEQAMRMWLLGPHGTRTTGAAGLR